MSSIGNTSASAVTRFLATVLIACAGATAAQDYPGKPIRIVTAPAGGSGDFLTRLIGQGIAAPLGQQIVVDNRPNGPTGPITVAKSPPDGHTLLMIGSTFWLEPLLQKSPYDAVADFSPITSAVASLSVLVVHPSLPVKSVKDVIALARARPGQLNYASTGAGGLAHLSMELFKSMAGVNIVDVPYKGGNPAIIALIGGEVQLMFSSAVSAIPHVKSGRLKALAVAAPRRSAVMPEVPTVAATGLPGYEYVSVIALFAPAKTPATIIRRLNQETVRFLSQPEIKAQILATGAEVVASSSEQLAAQMKSDIARLGKLIRDANIKTD